MEAEVAMVSSVVGILVNTWLIRDAWRDRKTYLSNDGYHHPTLDRITESRFVGEVIRGVVLWSFLLVALTFVLDLNVGRVGEIVVWLLALIPAMLAGWSIYEWWGRKKILSDTQIEHEDNDETIKEDDGDVGR